MWISQTDPNEFVDFLLEAKRATCAGQGDEATVTPLVPGSKQLEYRKGGRLPRGTGGVVDELCRRCDAAIAGAGGFLR